jgi:hypothetical protein
MHRGMRERLARIETEARTLARSGKFHSANAIEMALLARGFADAQKIFANRWTRSEIDRLCELAIWRGNGALEPKAA